MHVSLRSFEIIIVVTYYHFMCLISHSRSVFDVVDFKNKSAALIMSTLQSDINNCQQRTQRSMQKHTAHVTARKKEMEDTKVTKHCLVELSVNTLFFLGNAVKSVTSCKKKENTSHCLFVCGLVSAHCLSQYFP